MKGLLVRLAALLMIPAAASSAEFRSRLLDRVDRLFCESDRMYLCVGVGRRDAEACLIDHFDEIADSDCRAAVKAAKAQADEIMRSCRFDIDVHCIGMSYGSELLACFGRHRSELSGSCLRQL
jgi:hypothetical protein